MQTHSIIFLAASLFAFGCASSQGEQVRDARMAQADAQNDANTNAIDAQASAREDAIKQNGDAAESGASAPTSKLAEVSTDRAVYKSEAQAKLDKLAIRINTAQQKIAVLGGKAPTALKGELQTAASEHNLLKQDIDKVGAIEASDWEATTGGIDKRLSTLDERVTKLTESIEDV